MKLRLFLVFIGVAAFTQPVFSVEQGDDNPTGVTGIYNGQITTAGNYDPYTGNAMRVVDDIVVPGSVGAYPLKWTRYFNSHLTWHNDKIGGAWRFSYIDYKILNLDYKSFFATPDGRMIDNDAYGVEEYFDGAGLHLSD